MIASMSTDGIITVEAQNEIEAYALRHWVEAHESTADAGGLMVSWGKVLRVERMKAEGEIQ